MQSLLRTVVSFDKVRWVTRKCSSYTVRSHTCAELSPDLVGRRVTVAGWVQTSRRQFLLLRDRTGTAQLLLPDSRTHPATTALTGLPNESVVVVSGVVAARPPGQTNSRMQSGEVEVAAEEVHEVCPAPPSLPFQQNPHLLPRENLRLQYRYLDLRRPELQYNLAVRSALVHRMRQFLVDKKFLDIETPTLFRQTPGGAREFCVPSRQLGRAYSLVQSPQQFKQLLMVGGLDRYFQVARCYRDEGGRPDRQPEFTQLDIELSFAGREGVMQLVEELLVHCWPALLPAPFPRMEYRQAMDCYGVDKPDLRYDNKIVNLTSTFLNSGFKFLDDKMADPNFYVGGIFFDTNSGSCLKSVEKEVRAGSAGQAEAAREAGGALLISPLSTLAGLDCSIALKCGAVTAGRLEAAVGPGRLGFLVAGEKEAALAVLGRCRTALAATLLSAELATAPPAFLWVVDFPLFVVEEGKLQSAHHPFTAPHPADRHLFFTEPRRCRSLHYDLVLNGQEVGGGSVRLHSAAEQRFVLEEVLGEDTEELHHLLAALASGCPPHAGIALGLDRLVALITKASSIREVIAFPKSGDGVCSMSGAPAEITQEQRTLYNLK